MAKSDLILLVCHQYGPVSRLAGTERTQNLIAKKTRWFDVLIGKGTEGCMEGSCLAGGHRCHSIDALRNEIVETQGSLQREVGGLVNTISYPTGQAGIKRYFSENVPPINNALNVAFSLPFNEPAAVETRKRPLNFLSREENLRSELLVKDGLVHF